MFIVDYNINEVKGLKGKIFVVNVIIVYLY